MNRRMSWTWRLAAHGLLLLLGISYLLPLAWMLTTSLQPDADRAKNPPPMIPVPAEVDRQFEPDAEDGLAGGERDLFYAPTGQHYVEGITRVPIPLFLRNTLLVCALTVIGTIVSSSLVAYGFSVLRWPGRDLLFYIMLGTMMLPQHVTMVPVFTIWRRLGLIDTFAPLVVPAWLGAPFFIFLFRQFFLTIPRDLIDAARVDGAGELRIWATVVMPLSIPAMATVGLFSFLGAWNDYLQPLIYLADQGKYTLSLGLAMFRTQYGSEYGQMMAVASLMVVPIIVLFFFAQKTFIQGIKTSGLKG